MKKPSKSDQGVDHDILAKKASCFDSVTKRLNDVGLALDGLTDEDMANIIITLSTEGLKAHIGANIAHVKKVFDSLFSELSAVTRDAAQDAEYYLGEIREKYFEINSYHSNVESVLARNQIARQKDSKLHGDRGSMLRTEKGMVIDGKLYSFDPKNEEYIDHEFDESEDER